MLPQFSVPSSAVTISYTLAFLVDQIPRLEKIPRRYSLHIRGNLVMRSPQCTQLSALSDVAAEPCERPAGRKCGPDVQSSSHLSKNKADGKFNINLNNFQKYRAIISAPSPPVYQTSRPALEVTLCNGLDRQRAYFQILWPQHPPQRDLLP